MLNLSRRAVLTGGALLGTVAIALPTLAAGSGTPANKAVAAGSTIEVVGANQTATIMTATFKTSKPTDLLMSVSLECSILTALTTNNESNSASAAAGLRVHLEIDGKVVPITSTSTPPQDTPPAGTAAKDGATFCDREYSRTVTDQEDEPDGIDEESDYIKTKSAHAFNWVQLNAGSGLHTVAVVATFRNSVAGNAEAEAVIGNRTLVIEPTKLANDAVIAENGTS